MVINKRALARAITWEMFSTTLTGLISFPFTGSIISSSILAGICLLIKVVFYYLHEGLWKFYIPYGKTKKQN